MRWQPVSPTLTSHLLAHGENRGGLDSARRLLRYADGRPITSRRYDHLWQPAFLAEPDQALLGIEVFRYQREGASAPACRLYVQPRDQRVEGRVVPGARGDLEEFVQPAVGQRPAGAAQPARFGYMRCGVLGFGKDAVGDCASSAGTIARWAIRDKPHTICGRLALAQPLLPGDAQGMDLRPQAPEIPSAADEVPIDDLLAGVRTTAELNELIREGLAAARRGARIFPSPGGADAPSATKSPERRPEPPVRKSALGQGAVGFSPVTDADDQDGELFIGDLINDPIVANT
jgi:hypothetical protein